jgi:hypothetical protein
MADAVERFKALPEAVQRRLAAAVQREQAPSEPGKVNLAIRTVRTDPQYATLLGGTKKAVMALSDAEIDAADAAISNSFAKGVFETVERLEQQLTAAEARVQKLEAARDIAEELVCTHIREHAETKAQRDQLAEALDEVERETIDTRIQRIARVAFAAVRGETEE